MANCSICVRLPPYIKKQDLRWDAYTGLRYKFLWSNKNNCENRNRIFNKSKFI